MSCSLCSFTLLRVSSVRCRKWEMYCVTGKKEKLGTVLNDAWGYSWQMILCSFCDYLVTLGEFKGFKVTLSMWILNISILCSSFEISFQVLTIIRIKLRSGYHRVQWIRVILGILTIFKTCSLPVEGWTRFRIESHIKISSYYVFRQEVIMAWSCSGKHCSVQLKWIVCMIWYDIKYWNHMGRT